MARNKVLKYGKDNVLWRGGPIEVFCDSCGKSKLVKRCYESRKHHFCNPKCYHEWFRENCKNFSKPFYGHKQSEETRKHLSLIRGGTGIPYENVDYSGDFKRLREIIRKRDNYICQSCGFTEEEHLIVLGEVLSVHHIDYVKENLAETNLITTCRSCNTRANYNKGYWIEFYQNKIKSMGYQNGRSDNNNQEATQGSI